MPHYQERGAIDYCRRRQFDASHGLIVASALYENVSGHGANAEDENLIALAGKCSRSALAQEIPRGESSVRLPWCVGRIPTNVGGKSTG